MDRRHLLLNALALAAVPAAVRAEGGDGKKKKNGGDKQKKKTGGASYLPLETVTATLIRSDGHRGVLTVEVGLDVPDAAQRDKVEKILPRIRAAYVQSVQIYASGLPPATAPNADYIARELQRQTDLAVGGPGVKLLLGTILVN
jgi:hypothetical protein